MGRGRHLTTTLRLGIALAAAGTAVLAISAGPAGASRRQLTAVGGNTTDEVLHNIFGPSLNDLLPGGTTSNTTIAPTTQLCKGGVNYSAHKPAPHTGTLEYPTGAPNGSTAGKNALKAEEPSTVTTTRPATTPAHTVYDENTAGCVDFSRSSSPPKPSTVSAQFDYYAYGLDGVAPLTGSHAGGNNVHPVILSLKTVENIYRCKAHFMNWATVTGPKVATNPTKTTLHLTNQGGITAPIVRFWPQAGSGTRSVFSTMMGFTPDTATGHFKHGTKTDTCGTPATPFKGEAMTSFKTVAYHTAATNKTVVKRIVVDEENSEQGIIFYSHLSGNATVNGETLQTPKATAIKDAIFLYSAGRFENEWDTSAKYNGTYVNTITNQTPGIGNFNANTLRLARMLTETTANHPGTNANSFEVYGPPVEGTFTATTNRGLESINTTTIQEQYEWFSHIPAGTKSPHTSKSPIPGIRYIYNVADQALPTYSEVKMTVGFDNVTGGTKSALCSGDDAAAISGSGFVPLNMGSTGPANRGGGYGTTGHAPTFGGTSDRAGAACREFQGQHLPDWGTPQAWTPSTWEPST